MKRGVLSLVLACAETACGLDAIPGLPPGDTAASDASTSDADASTDAAEDETLPTDGGLPGLADARVPPPDDEASTASAVCRPRQDASVLFEGDAAVQLEGVTRDGYAVYAVYNGGDSGTWSVYAQPLDAGAPTSVVTDYAFGSPGTGAIVVSRSTPTVLLWDSCADGVDCRLRTWSSALPSDAGPVTQCPDGGACWGAASDDGTSVMYVGNLNTNASLGSIIGVSIDGGLSTTLVPTVALGTGSTPCGTVGLLQKTCAPNFGFVGPGAGQRAIAAYCQPMASTADIVSFAYPFDTRTPDAGVDLTPTTGANPNWTTDSSGELLFVTNKAGKPLLIDTADGERTSFPEYGASTSGLVSPDGKRVYFVASSEGQAPCADSGVPTALWVGGSDGGVRGSPLACGVDDILTTSRDGGTAFFDTREGLEGGTNLYAAELPAKDAGPNVETLASRTGTFLIGFTSDQSRLVWIGALPARGGGIGLPSGSLLAYESGRPRPLPILEPVATNVVMAEGAKVVALASPFALPNPDFTDWRGDLYLVDVAQPGSPSQILANGAYYRFAVDHSGKDVVFACNGAGERSAVYVQRVGK